MITLESILPSGNVSELWITVIYVNNSPCSVKPERCRDYSSCFPWAGESLSWIWHSLFWPIRHLFMLLDFWPWSKRGKNSRWHLDEIPSNLYTLVAMEKRKGMDFQRCTHSTESTLHVLWQIHISSGMLQHVCTSPSYNHISSLIPSRPLQFQGSMLLRIKM